MIAYPDSIEASLFFRLATTDPVKGDWVSAADLSRELDWDSLIAIALRENSVTLLSERVSTLPSLALPREKREQIARLSFIWTFKLKVLEQRLEESVALLSRSGIEVTLLKGAGLALTTYRGFVDRPMADIDILIDAHSAHRAHELLQKNGWALDSASYPENTWENHHHLPPLTDTAGSGLRLELHVAPLAPGHPFKLDVADLMTNSRMIPLGGSQVRVLDPHRHAVHASIHFAWSHRFAAGALNAFRDLASFEQSASFSWDEFVAVAHETRSELPCYWTVRLARILAGVPVPDQVLSRLAPAMGDRVLGVLERHFSELIFRSERACPSAALRSRLWAFALRSDPPRTAETTRWTTRNAIDSRLSASSIRQAVSHAKALARWRRYVTSLFTTAVA